MRKLFLACALVPCVVTLLGCPKRSGDATDAGDEASVVVAVVDAAPAAPVAKNVNDVARFPAEKPLTDDAQKTVDPFATAHTGCKSGNQVAPVKAGTDPFKIAEFQDCTLVTFPDPKDANSTLMGWIPTAAFTHVSVAVIGDAGLKDAAVVPAVATTLKCPAGQEAIVNIGRDPTCRKKCKVDKDCKTPTANACLNANTVAGHIASVCANETP